MMHVVKCPSCDVLLQETSVEKGYKACCPYCDTKITSISSLTLSGELALAITALLLLYSALEFPLIAIDLFAQEQFTTVTNGALLMFQHYPFVSSLVIFCTAIAPLCFLLSILVSHYAMHKRNAKILYHSTKWIDRLQEWVMIDVFLVALTIAIFKARDISEISLGSGLFSFIILQIILALLLCRASPRRYWARIPYPKALPPSLSKPHEDELVTCSVCGLLQHEGHSHCLRCHHHLEKRKFQSIQRTWALLLTALVFIFPANLYPISSIITNGKAADDTIFSGVSALINHGSYGVAIIIFVASILVPITKIVGLMYVLICIHLKIETGRKQRMKLFKFIHTIGKWSMMDLCVIAIMVSLLDRGNLLSFTPGAGAIAFGIVVIMTIFAANSLDSRLIWDKYE